MGAKNTKVEQSPSVLSALAKPLVDNEPVASRKRSRIDDLGYVPGSLSKYPPSTTRSLPVTPEWLQEDAAEIDPPTKMDSKEPIVTQIGDSKQPIMKDPNPKMFELQSLQSDSKTPMSELQLSRYPYLQIGQLCSHQNKNGFRYLADVLGVDEKTMSVQLRYSRVTNDAQPFWVQLPDKSVAPASYETTTNTVYTDRDVASRTAMMQQGIQCVCDPSFQCHCALKLDA